MSHVENKVDWCLRKGEREMKESGTHRGLVRITPSKQQALEHVRKAEHFLEATTYLKNGGFSDISASTVFYAMYHSLLAIAVRSGYESRNQECTFALIASFINEGRIKLTQGTLDKIAALGVNDSETSIKIRERYQYGTSLSLDEDMYSQLVNLAQEIISQAKVIIEE